jgi:hypothetical protein
LFEILNLRLRTAILDFGFQVSDTRLQVLDVFIHAAMVRGAQDHTSLRFLLLGIYIVQ